MDTQQLIGSLLAQFSDYYRVTVMSLLKSDRLLAQMIGYHHGWNDPDGNLITAPIGKQVRPLIALVSCAAMGAKPECALSLACGIELIHNFSLIHDDIMDASTTRRGKAAVWTIWGVNQAINAGDGTYGLAFQALAEPTVSDPDPWHIVHGQRLLSKACVDTVYGQTLDIQFETQDNVTTDAYLNMVSLKTGPLLGVALGGGALFGGATAQTVKDLTQMGRHLGIAFQIQDDILGIWGDPHVTGKPNMDDITHKKKSLPILWGMQHLPESALEIFKHLYAQPAPINDSDALTIARLLTEHGVQKEVESIAEYYYQQVVEGIQKHYPDSPYREALLAIASLIVHRSS